VNVCRLQGWLFVSVAPCPTQAGWVTERGQDISITIAVRSVFYGSSDARTESSREREREREREGRQVRMKWLARVAGV
jgi:hypothetical protein